MQDRKLDMFAGVSYSPTLGDQNVMTREPLLAMSYYLFSTI